MKPVRAADISRRDMLKKAVTTVGGASAAFGGSASASQERQGAAAPARRTPSQVGQTFRGYVRFGTGASVQELKLLPIGPRQVVVRTEAAQLCYTTTAQGLGSTPVTQAVVPAHGGVGIVIEVGSTVERVQVGDRVIVAGQAQCGVCYNCLRGRADHCLMGGGGGRATDPFAEMRDGTKVAGFRGGCAELMVTYEDYCVPVVTAVSPVELAMLHDVGMVGLAATMTKVKIEVGTDAVILGCGRDRCLQLSSRTVCTVSGLTFLRWELVRGAEGCWRAIPPTAVRVSGWTPAYGQEAAIIFMCFTPR